MSARLFSTRMALRRGVATAARTARKTPTSPRLALAGAVAIAVPAYLLFANSREQVALEAKKVPGRPGQGVTVAELLNRKEGSEVWVVINGDVYDMSQFLDDHPGGRDIILANRSHDVTRLFGPRHPRDALEPANLPDTVKRVGPLRATDAELAEIALKMSEDELAEMERMRAARDAFEEKGLGSIINMRDFERAAEPLLSKVAWAYYASAGDDEITKNANADAYQRVLFRPRVLRKVGEADARTDLVGCPTSIPVFIAPAAMAKLGHPLGEINLTRGAGSTGVIQAISSNASVGMDEMIAERLPGQPLFYQLYVNRDRAKAKELIKRIDANKFDAIMLTADAPVGGKRERDLRLKGDFEGPAGGVSIKSDDAQGVSQAMFAGVDPDLCWEDIKWIRSLTKIPIVVKGIQTVEDAVQAYQAGCDGILISNHGGRQLDTTRPSLDVLLEIRRWAPHLLRPEFRAATGPSAESIAHPDRLTPRDEPDATGPTPRRFDILIDGGIHRGTDVVKALCLGANGVGIGRGFLFAQSVAGEEGVERAVGILKSEIELAIRLLGANKISDLRPSMVEVKEK